MSRKKTMQQLAADKDGAVTVAANDALAAGRQINHITTDMNIKAASNALIAAKAVKRVLNYSQEAKDKISAMANKDEWVTLAKSLTNGNIENAKVSVAKLKELRKSIIADKDKSKLYSEELKTIASLEQGLADSSISQSQLVTAGSRLTSMIRRRYERVLIDSGDLSLRDAKYEIDPGELYKIDLFKKKVKAAQDESNAQLNQKKTFANRKARRLAKARLEAANKLMDELDYAKANSGNKTLHDVAIEVSKELDTAFATEKELGYDYRFDDSFMPGRYDAEFFNNDGVSFGEKRVLGLSQGAKTFENYYEAIAAGPYIAVTRDPASMVEHRVRQGRTKVNMSTWEDGWKAMTDEYSNAPVAVPTKKVGNKDIPDPPRGLQGAQYEVVTKADGTKMGVLVGYDKLYRSLTDPSAVLNSNIGRNALLASQFLKHTVLMGDFFHFGRISFYAAAVGGIKNVRGQFKHGWTALEYRESQLDRAVELGEITKAQADWAREKVAFNNNGKQEAISRIELVKRMQKAGLNVGQIQDAIYRDLAKHMPIIGGLNVKWSRFLFDKWTRGLMTKSAVAEFERISKLNPDGDSEKLIRSVSKDMNNFFGSIGSQGWITSRTWQDVSRMCLLAPQWFEGIVKKDFAIPYKLATGVKNGEALKMLKGQESIGRGVARGLLFMAAATQVANLIINRKPTWENTDKEHKWDADFGGGVFVSPLSVYNEILHDIIRYNETKPKFFDAIQQIGENKLGFYGRAAVIMATSKKGTGEYITTTPGIAAEVGKTFIPVPITLKGPVGLASDIVQGKELSPQNKKAFWSLFGLKAEAQRSAMARTQASAAEFLKANGLSNASFVLSPTDEVGYHTLRKAIENNDISGANQIYKKLRETKSKFKIYSAMREWENRTFTGSKKNERKWLHEVGEEGRALYNEGIAYKRGLYNKWKTFYANVED
jgi:hypothetical protein